VIKVYLSTPCIAFLSIDLQPNDQQVDFFRYEGVYDHHAQSVLQFGRDRPNKGITAPKILPKMANISVSDVLRPNYRWCRLSAAVYGCALLLLVTFALDELAVSWPQSTRTHLSGN